MATNKGREQLLAYYWHGASDELSPLDIYGELTPSEKYSIAIKDSKGITLRDSREFNSGEELNKEIDWLIGALEDRRFVVRIKPAA